MSIWCGHIARVLVPLVQMEYETSAALDDDYQAPETMHAVELADPISGALAAHGVDVPGRDRQLWAYLTMYASPVRDGVLWSVTRVRSEGSGVRLGVMSHSGVIETVGDHLGRVNNPDMGRYETWYGLPGVWYPGGGSR